MMLLIMSALLLSACNLRDQTAEEKKEAGNRGNLSLVIENSQIVFKQSRQKLANLHIEEQLTTLPLTNNDNVRQLRAVFFDTGSGGDSISTLQLSDLQLSYEHANNTINCHFHNAPLAAPLPATSCSDAVVENTSAVVRAPAADNEHRLAMRQRLAAQGFNRLARDRNDMTLLHYAAAMKKNVQTMQFLLEQAAFNIDAPNYLGDTPLHLAARYGDAEGLRYLLSLPKIDKTIRNHKGKTAHDIASERKELSHVAPSLR